MPQSIDKCCQAFIDGDDLLQGACQTTVEDFSPMLSYDDVNLCHTKSIRRT